MDGPTLQNRIHRGMGVAARRIGSQYTVYRPNSATAPLSSRNRVIRLYAAFNAGDGSFRRAESYNDPVWWGVFDALYTQPGDYLTAPDATYFIATQAPLLPVGCIRTNRIINIIRPAPLLNGAYSGMVASDATRIVDGWPAAVDSATTRISGNLPETRFGNWSVLLPPLPAEPQIADVIVDDQMRCFVVGAAEQSSMGWRLTAREVAG